MLFFKKKSSDNPVLDDFENQFKNYPEALKYEIDKSISITDFFMTNVQTQFFKELKEASNTMYISPEIEDLVYCTLFYGMEYTGFSEQQKLRFNFIATPIIFARNKAELNPDEVDKLIPLGVDDIDKDLHISFMQLMTRIYEKWDKEFSEDEMPKYQKLFNIYGNFMMGFMKGMSVGLANSSPNQIHAKAKEIRRKYKQPQLMMIQMFAVLSTNK